MFEHSGKTYSRDLFLFVILAFFAYGIYTIKPIHDLTLLGREQTEGKSEVTATFLLWKVKILICIINIILLRVS